MKPLRTVGKGSAGGALVIALCTAFVLAISLGGYLAFVEQQHYLGVRSQSWNTSLAIAEAGIEEGMQHLNANFPHLFKDGWAVSTNGYVLSRALPSGETYNVTIRQGSDTNKAFVISRVAINAPRQPRGGTLVTPTELSAEGPVEGTRAVRVYCEKSHLFSAGLIVKHDIFLKGNKMMVDSFDSTDPNKSDNGHYNPHKYSGDKGDVATNGGIGDEVGLGNASIFGQVHTGPGCPVTLGPGGSIGTHEFVSSSTGKIQEGYLLQDSNFAFPETELPDSLGLVPPASGIVGVVSNTVTSNVVTSFTYPVPPPSSGVVTNVEFASSFTFPSPTPEWVTTNIVVITTNWVPVPPPADLQTNFYTTNVTSRTFPAPPIEYVGGVLTNKVKGKINYSYNLVLGKDYTYSLASYTFPKYSYTYDEVGSFVTYSTNYYEQVIPGNGIFVASSLAGNTIVTGKDAVLILPYGLQGIEHVVIQPGASLTVYAGGTTANFSGKDWVNQSGTAAGLVVYCAPSVTSLNFTGNGQFIGVLAAPNADVTLSGSGNSIEEFCGSLMCKNLTMNGSYSFHYDEALTKGPPNGRFRVMSWDEIP